MTIAKSKRSLIIKIILIVLIVLVAYGIIHSRRNGGFGVKRVTAVVVGKRGGSQSTLNLAFTTQDGQEASQTVKVSKEVFDATAIRDEIEIMYDTDDPTIVELA